jgi:hypothetical protein
MGLSGPRVSVDQRPYSDSADSVSGMVVAPHESGQWGRGGGVSRGRQGMGVKGTGPMKIIIRGALAARMQRGNDPSRGDLPERVGRTGRSPSAIKKLLQASCAFPIPRTGVCI